MAADLQGLTGEVGDLILLPRSHRAVVDRGRDQLGALFGTDALPGSLTVDCLPQGSAVIVHSALLHGRRPRPGGENRPRYFSDISYCQHPQPQQQRGAHWPSYQVASRSDKHADPGGHGQGEPSCEQQPCRTQLISPPAAQVLALARLKAAVG